MKRIKQLCEFFIKVLSKEFFENTDRVDSLFDKLATEDKLSPVFFKTMTKLVNEDVDSDKVEGVIEAEYKATPEKLDEDVVRIMAMTTYQAEKKQFILKKGDTIIGIEDNKKKAFDKLVNITPDIEGGELDLTGYKIQIFADKPVEKTAEVNKELPSEGGGEEKRGGGGGGAAPPPWGRTPPA